MSLTLILCCSFYRFITGLQKGQIKKKSTINLCEGAGDLLKKLIYILLINAKLNN